MKNSASQNKSRKERKGPQRRGILRHLDRENSEGGASGGKGTTKDRLEK